MERWKGTLALAVLGLGALACGGTTAGAGGATISDYVWIDANGDGIQQDEEQGLPGVTVELHTADRTSQLASTTTDADGLYSFTEVEAGTYRLYFDPPEGFDLTRKDQGDDDAVDSDAIQSGSEEGWTDTFEVGSGSDSTRDAGVAPSVAVLVTPSPTPLGKIGQDVTPIPIPPEQTIGVRYVVVIDKAGHKIYVDLPDQTEMTVRRDAGKITLVIEGHDITVTCIELTGEVAEDGSFVAKGTGPVAGFQNIHGTFTGTIEYDADGQGRLSGSLVLGDEMNLPQGESITYDVESVQ